MTATPIRDAMELQRAHDILRMVVTGEVRLDLDAYDRMALHAAFDCLCWVLLHKDNTAFSEAIERIEKALASNGYELMRVN